MELSEEARYEVRTAKRVVFYTDDSSPQYFGEVSVEWYESADCYGGHAEHTVNIGPFGDREDFEKALDNLRTEIQRRCSDIVALARSLRAEGYTVEVLTQPVEDC